MGDLIPMRDHAATAAAQTHDADSPWFRPAPDWETCTGCLIRGACREVRECHDPDGFSTTDSEPDITLRLVGPPDIVA